MKKHLILSLLISSISFFAFAQEDYKVAGEKFPIHDLESKLDFQLMEKDGGNYLKVWINTHLNLGCIDTSEYIILYLDNGSDVDLRPLAKNCGALSENKKHSDYELYYEVPSEGLELLKTHKMEYFELEAEHQTLERKASQFQNISKEHFETYFMKNLPVTADETAVPADDTEAE